jgi:hypothetical protein
MEAIMLLLAVLLSSVFVTFWGVSVFGAVQMLCTPGPQWPSLRRGLALSGTISITALTLLTLVV